MISLPIRNHQGQDVGSYEFDPQELASGVNKQLLHDAVVMYEANRRVGTVRTKSRGDVAGSTKKIYRQKGTGRARMGASRTPVRRGGGHTFAKVPRDWGFRLPKKAVRQATRMALLSKFLDNQATVIDELVIHEPKTRVVVELLNALELGNETCLLATEQYDNAVWRSSRIIPTLWVSPVLELNAYDLLHQRELLITKAALDGVRGIRGGNGSATESAVSPE